MRWWPSATAWCQHPPGRGLVQTLGIESLSKSQVSRRLASSMRWTQLRNRPLDAGPYTYVSLDALTQKVREGGRIVNVAVVIAVGVNVDGHLECSASTSSPQDGAGWLPFLGSGRPRSGRRHPGDLRRHPGLVDAVPDVDRGCVAAVPHPLHAQPVDPSPKRAQRWSPRWCTRIFTEPARRRCRTNTWVDEQLAERFPQPPSSSPRLQRRPARTGVAKNTVNAHPVMPPPSTRPAQGSAVTPLDSAFVLRSQCSPR